jgi:hypothetical protein
VLFVKGRNKERSDGRKEGRKERKEERKKERNGRKERGPLYSIKETDVSIFPITTSSHLLAPYLFSVYTINGFTCVCKE